MADSIETFDRSAGIAFDCCRYWLVSLEQLLDSQRTTKYFDGDDVFHDDLDSYGEMMSFHSWKDFVKSRRKILSTNSRETSVCCTHSSLSI